MMRDDAKKIINVIKDNFSNGIRDDAIDVKKVLCICLANRPTEKISVDFIRDVIRSEGIKVGKRFYFVSEKEIEKILLFLDVILKRNRIVFYSIAYEKHRDFFSKLNIFSSEILKKILQQYDSENFYFEDFFCLDKVKGLKYEIAKLFAASDSPLSLKDVKKFFPYVPEKKILSELKTKKYLPTISGKYLSVLKVRIDRAEIFRQRKKFWHRKIMIFHHTLLCIPKFPKKFCLNLLTKYFSLIDLYCAEKIFSKRPIIPKM